MSYLNRATASARRLVEHFATREGTREMTLTLTRRDSGGISSTTLKPASESSTDYAGEGFIMTDSTFFADAGVDRTGDLAVGVFKKNFSATPQENDEVTCDGHTGTVLKVHDRTTHWIMECAQ